LAFSFLSTGLSGFYFATIPPFKVVMGLFVFWGITSILTFWAALIKAVRMLGESSEQGRLYGLLEGGRGVAVTVVGFITLAVFAKLGSATAGLSGVIVVFSVFLTLAGVLTIVFFKDTKSDEKTGVLVNDVIKVIKMPKVWMIAVIIFCAYTITDCASYLVPYLSTVFKASVGLAAALGIVRTDVMQLVGGPIFGFSADKMHNRPKLIMIGFILMACCIGLFLLLPGQVSLLVIAVVIMLVLSLVGFGMRGIYYSIIDDAKVPLAVTGAAAGLAALIGYIPDIYIFTLIGGWLDKYKGQAGYQHMFVYMFIDTLVGVAVTVLFIHSVKKTNTAKLNAAKFQDAAVSK
jgi:predicted MFS family arabinose efflux permease